MATTTDVVAEWSRAIGKALRAQGFVSVARSAQRADRWVLKTATGAEYDLMDRLPDVMGRLIAAHFPNRKKE